VERSTSAELLARGRARKENGEKGWNLDLVVGQLYQGTVNSVVVEEEGRDNDLLGVVEENLMDVVKEILADVQS
jgi:hypothetical protein